MDLKIISKTKFNLNFHNDSKKSILYRFLESKKIKTKFSEYMKKVEKKSLGQFKPFLDLFCKELGIENIKFKTKFEFWLDEQNKIVNVNVTYNVKFGKGVSGDIYYNNSALRLKLYLKDDVLELVNSIETDLDKNRIFKDDENLYIHCQILNKMIIEKNKKKSYRNRFESMLMNTIIYWMSIYFKREINNTNERFVKNFENVNKFINKMCKEFEFQKDTAEHDFTTIYNIYADKILWKITHSTHNAADVENEQNFISTFKMSDRVDIEKTSTKEILKAFVSAGILNSCTLDYELEEEINDSDLSELFRISKLMNY